LKQLYKENKNSNSTNLLQTNKLPHKGNPNSEIPKGFLKLRKI